MSHNVCRVPGCTCTGRTTSDLSFHRFPRDEPRCSDWIQRIDPSLVQKSVDYVNKLRVCGLHFSQDKFRCAADKRKLLLNDAVPNINLPFVTNAVSSDQGTIGNSSMACSSEQSTSHSADLLNTFISDVAEGSCEPTLSQTAEIVTTPLSGVAERFFSEAVSSETSISPGPSTSAGELTTPLSGRSRTSSRKRSASAAEPTTPLLGTSRKSCRKRLLQQLDLSTKEITPRKKKILEFAKATKKNYDRLRRRIEETKGNMKQLKRVADCKSMDFFLQHDISPAAAALACGDARNRIVQPKHRRWTKREKLLALALYKRSPKAYRFLSSMIVLPSRSTVNKMLHSIPFNIGINEKIIQNLGARVKKMNTGKQRGNEFCALYFDEMSLRIGFNYRENEDKVEGFEDYGEFGRSERAADHALVFMARGLRKQWKQPVAYYFCHTTTPSEFLKELIVNVIQSLSSAGIIVKAVVCDQGSTNRSALKDLVKQSAKDTNSDFMFQVNGENIVTIFDAPHLLKSVRNNLMKYDLVTGNGMAKWEYVKELLQGNSDHLYSLMHKITTAHVEPKMKEKMRVYLAAQIFSRTCSCAMKILINKEVMPADAMSTAELLLFMNNLFDSVNGSARFPPPQNLLKCRLSTSSGHTAFWENALVQINNFQFVDVTGKVSRPPCQDGWITTIKAIRHLWQDLQGKGFSFLNLRCLNQDGLENWFAAIRQFGGDNNNPTCAQFSAAFKACVLNGFCSSKSREKNCEDDDGQLLSRLENFIGNCTEDSLIPSNVSDSSSRIGDITSLEDLSVPEAQAADYVSGYIVKRLLKTNNTDCTVCRDSLTAKPGSSRCNIVDARDVDGRLKHAPEEFSQDVKEALKIAKVFLPQKFFSDALGSQLSRLIREQCRFTWVKCSNHKEFMEHVINDMNFGALGLYLIEVFLRFPSIVRQMPDLTAAVLHHRCTLAEGDSKFMEFDLVVAVLRHQCISHGGKKKIPGEIWWFLTFSLHGERTLIASF